MPTYPPPDNPLVVRASLIFSRDTRVFVNTFHFSRAAGWTLTNMGDLASDLVDWWTNIYRGAIPSAVALTQVQIRKYDPTNPLAVDFPVSPPVPGTRTGAPDAGNVTLTMSERTGLAGRAYRGRVYVPSLSEADVSDTDTLASVAVAVLANAIGGIIGSSWSSSGGILGVFHRPTLVSHLLDNTITNVTGYIIENIIDSQRRRLPQRGR